MSPDFSSGQPYNQLKPTQKYSDPYELSFFQVNQIVYLHVQILSTVLFSVSDSAEPTP